MLLGHLEKFWIGKKIQQMFGQTVCTKHIIQVHFFNSIKEDEELFQVTHKSLKASLKKNQPPTRKIVTYKPRQKAKMRFSLSTLK